MRYYLLTLLTITSLSLNAQSVAKQIQNAKGEISRNNYRGAIKILEPVVDISSNNKEAVMLTGFCYLNIGGEEEKAWRYLEKAAALNPLGEKPSLEALETHFYLAESLHQNNRFEQAIAIYEKLLTLTKSSQKKLTDAIHIEMQYSKNAIEMVKKPRDFKIYPLGNAINTIYEEHSPLVALDESTIYFTSNRPVDGIESENGEYFENIYVSYWREGKWTDAQLLELPGDYFGNRATVSLSTDGNTLIIYQNDGYAGSLFVTQYSFRGWSEPVPLPVNSSNFNETHACFSADGTEIWFSSDRPGGMGGKDIYVSYQLPDGRWGEAINAGANVNTEMDDDSPFLSADGTRLFYSSEGGNSMGGFDIFVNAGREEDGSWLKGENIGYPVNTANDDVFYLPTPDGQRVYYSSRRMGGVGESDIYVIVYPDEDARALSAVAGYVFNPDEKPNDNAVIKVTDSDGAQHGIYRPNPLTGKFVAILPTGVDYKFEVEAEGFKPHTVAVPVPLNDVYGTRQRATYIPNIILENQ
ncbi:MAG: hypothetical protein LBV41_00270 [Cytophagaceae bacterium]|nr:hypothetical protein [Cytophagaceae bacterium]